MQSCWQLWASCICGILALNDSADSASLQRWHDTFPKQFQADWCSLETIDYMQLQGWERTSRLLFVPQQWEHSSHLSLSTKKDCAPLRGLFGKCVDAWSQKCQDNSSSRFDHPGHSLFLVPTLCIKGTSQWDQKIKCTGTHLVLSYDTGSIQEHRWLSSDVANQESTLALLHFNMFHSFCRTTLTWMWRWSNTVWLLCTRRTLPSYGISLHLNLRRHVHIGRRVDMFEDLSMWFASVEIIDDTDVVWVEGCLSCLPRPASQHWHVLLWEDKVCGCDRLRLAEKKRMRMRICFTHDLSWINLEVWSEHFIWIHLSGSFPTIWVFSAWFSCVFLFVSRQVVLPVEVGCPWGSEKLWYARFGASQHRAIRLRTSGLS